LKRRGGIGGWWAGLICRFDAVDGHVCPCGRSLMIGTRQDGQDAIPRLLTKGAAVADVTSIVDFRSTMRRISPENVT
jgi:hypothetical protein